MVDREKEYSSVLDSALIYREWLCTMTSCYTTATHDILLVSILYSCVNIIDTCNRNPLKRMIPQNSSFFVAGRNPSASGSPLIAGVLHVSIVVTWQNKQLGL